MATYTYTILTSPPAAPTARLTSITGTVPAGPAVVDIWYNPDDKVTYTITESNPVFYNQTLITSLSMPNVTNILALDISGICQGCTALTSFSAPNLTQLNCKNAFRNCTSLLWSNIDLGSITSVPESTFRGCTSFSTGVAVPSYITSIGQYAFAEIPSLSSSELSLGGVTSISTGMFYNSGTDVGALTNIDLSTLSSAPITQLGDSVFEGCYRLTAFRGASLNSIGIRVFYNCRLTSTQLSPIILGAITIIPEYTFYSCALEYIKLSDISTGIITSIGNGAFFGCSRLTTFDGRYMVPSMLTLGTDVFRGCTLLDVVNLGNVSVIPDRTFADCTSINSYLGGILNLSAGALSDLDITSMGSRAFQSCQSLTMVIGTSSLSSIGTAAFQQCLNLKSAINLGIITSVPDLLFSGTAIGNIGDIIPNPGPVDLENIFINPISALGSSVFENCRSISSFIGSDLISMGTRVFNRCTNLTSVNLGAVTEISNYTFNGCSSLLNINLGLISTKPITTLGDYVFGDCSSLTSFSGPNITSIGVGAFDYCYSLVKFFLGSSTPPAFTSPLFYLTSLLTRVCYDSRYSAAWPATYDGKTTVAYQRIAISAPSTAFQSGQQLVTVVETGGAPPSGVPSLNESANWYKNNVAIGGEMSPSLIILQTTPPATYQYIIQNDFEKVYSDTYSVDNYITANRFTIMYRPVTLPTQPYF